MIRSSQPPRPLLRSRGAVLLILVQALPAVAPPPGERATAVSPFEALCRDAQAAVFRGMLAPDEAGRLQALEQASALAREAVALEPGQPEGHHLLAVAMGIEIDYVGPAEKIGLARRIHAEAERVLELDPHHAGAHHVLGRLHAGVMRMPRLMRFLARRILGGEALKEASWERAEAHLRAAAEGQPEVIIHHLELGILLAVRGQRERALEAMEHALALPPSLPPDPYYLEQARGLRGVLLAGETPKDPTSFISVDDVDRPPLTPPGATAGGAPPPFGDEG